MVLQSRKEAANAVQAKLDAETIMAKVVAETERKLKAMQSEIESDRLHDTKKRLAETDLLKEEVKLQQSIAELRYEESMKL